MSIYIFSKCFKIFHALMNFNDFTNTRLVKMSCKFKVKYHN